MINQALEPLEQQAGDDSQAPLLTIRPVKGFTIISLSELWQYRDLLVTLAIRDIKVRYKQTALGVVWVILQPLLAAGIFSFVFGKVAKMPTDGVPSFIFSYAGLLGWGVFANTLTRTSICLVGNSNLISKVYFPRLTLPLSTLGSVLVDSGVAAVMMGVIMAVNGIVPGWPMLLLPLWILLLVACSLGAGLWAAALTVPYRDVQYVLPVAIQLGLYASPVAYSVSAVPEKYWMLYYANPLASLMDAFRWSVLGSTHVPEVWPLVYGGIMSMVFLVLGAAVFKKMERKFADVI